MPGKFKVGDTVYTICLVHDSWHIQENTVERSRAYVRIEDRDSFICVGDDKYVLKGLSYRTRKEAQDAMVNIIGQHIDRVNYTLSKLQKSLEKATSNV